jgi:tetratricopeptide (TPR) repeat protein
MKTSNCLVPVLLASCMLQACSNAPLNKEFAITPVFKAENSAGIDAPALYRLGRYHQQRGELAAADAAFARSITLDPHQLEARNARAALWANQGNLDAAVALLQQLVTEFPDQVQPRNNLGYAYHLQGREDAALSTLQLALSLDPAHPQTRANLALLHPSAQRAVATLASAAADTAPSARMEVVQLAPNEFRLQATTASRELSARQFQIVNGHGARGGGERVRVLLASHGIVAGRVVNQRGHYQRTTIIEYLPSQQRQANAVLSALQGCATLLPVRTLPQGLALRLVLGRDHATHLAALDHVSANGGAPLVAALDRVARPYFNQE